jgi:hypothetical protein
MVQEMITNLKRKTEKERIEGLLSYYKRLTNINSMAEVVSKVNDAFGKRTRSKVSQLIMEAHTHGVVLGLQEALQVLEVGV